MPFFDVKDGTNFRMHYEVVPHVVPETILFLHGNCASTRWWYPAEEVWKREAKSAGQNFAGSLIYADFRGCGKSSTPQDMSEVDMHRFADDNIALIRSLNLGRINLVGHSTGGLVAALMLAKEPSLFNKAVLLDPVGASGVKFDPSMIAAFEQMKVDKNLVATVLGATIYENDSQSDFFRQIVIEDAFHCVNAIGHNIIKALDGFNGREEMSRVPNEVLVLHGEYDTLLPIEASKKLAEILPKGEFRMIKGHGHCLNAEDPAQFVGITRSFFFPST